MDFLTLDEVLAVHAMQVRHFGGAKGIRDLGLLESAVANAEATFGGKLLHTTLFEAAAAYLHGTCRNHPFIDGNKRTAAAAALTFLHMNGTVVDAGEDALYELVIRVAEGKVSKAAVAVFLEQRAR